MMEEIKKLNQETIEITRTWTETKDKYLSAKAQIEQQIAEKKAKIDEEAAPMLNQINAMLEKFK